MNIAAYLNSFQPIKAEVIESPVKYNKQNHPFFIRGQENLKKVRDLIGDKPISKGEIATTLGMSKRQVQSYVERLPVNVFYVKQVAYYVIAK